MRTSTIRSAAIGAAVGFGFLAVGSARADDNSASTCVATTAVAAASAEPAAAAAAPTTVAAAPTTAAAAPTTVAAAPTTAAAAPTTAAGAPTTAAGAPTTVAGAPTTVAGAPTTVAGAPATDAAMLGAGATVQQFQAALVLVLGPTTDIAAEVAPLGLTPAPGIPTPEGAVVEDISVYYYPNADDPSRSYYDATMRFTATLPAADMITLFQTQMTAAGFIQTADSVENEDGRQERWLTYDIPDATYDNAEVVVAIVDGDTDFGQLNIRYTLDPAAINIFSSWATGLPLVDQATEITDASLRLNDYGSNYEASVRTSWNLPIAQPDAHAQLLAALPSTPYTPDTDYEPDENTAYLAGGEFLTLTVSTNEGYPEDTSYLSASATFDIQL